MTKAEEKKSFRNPLQHVIAVTFTTISSEFVNKNTFKVVFETFKQNPLLAPRAGSELAGGLGVSRVIGFHPSEALGAGVGLRSPAHVTRETFCELPHPLHCMYLNCDSGYVQERSHDTATNHNYTPLLRVGVMWGIVHSNTIVLCTVRQITDSSRHTHVVGVIRRGWHRARLSRCRPQLRRHASCPLPFPIESHRCS